MSDSCDPMASLSMGFSRWEYWSGLPCPPPGDLPDPGMEPVSLSSPALTGRFFSTTATWESLESTSDHKKSLEWFSKFLGTHPLFDNMDISIDKSEQK